MSMNWTTVSPLPRIKWTRGLQFTLKADHYIAWQGIAPWSDIIWC